MSDRPEFPQTVTVSYRVTNRHTVSIPGWRPALLNELFKSVSSRIVLKKIDRETIWQSFRKLDIPIATGRRRVIVKITWDWKNVPDADAPFKSVSDALVWNSFLISDRVEHVCFAEPVYRKGERGTVIVLEDLQ